MKTTVHIVSYTHWDREFRWQYELTRMRLVECLDHLFEIMREKPDYKSFHLDGQVQLLEDYLEIRPEQEAFVRSLIAANRLEVGPWYSLPDCAALNGESVIRNLHEGVRLSQSYGSVLRFGYNVFSFGQIGQLPQIYSHFGIDTIIFYKSLNPARTKSPEFIWESPDGTRAYASRLGPEARWNYFFAGMIPIVFDRDPWDKGWRYDYGTLGKVVHTAGPDDHGWFHEIEDPETSFHKENIKKGFERTLETVKNTSIPEALLFFDGTDFTEPHPLTPEIIGELQAQCAGDKYEIVHSRLSAYLSEMRDNMKRREGELEVVVGAMRDGPVGHVHSDVMNMHIELNLLNGAVENRILRYAEPLSAMAFASGIDGYPHTYLAKTWKLLFESHAHDSIHGLGPKELSAGAVARLSQAGLIAQGLERKGLRNLTKEISTENEQDATTFLAVHNTAAFNRTEVVEAWIDIPSEVALDKVVIEDPSGAACQVQEIKREQTRGGIYHARGRNMPFYCTRVGLLFEAKDVPALGYKTFKIKWIAKREYPYPHEEFDPPRIIENDMLTGPRSAANEHIALAIDTDGTLTVTHRESGAVYSGLNSLLDVGDRSNMWVFAPLDQDRIITSRGAPARIACTRRGPLEAAFVIETELEIPACFDFAKQLRSKELVTLTMRSELNLRKGSRFVAVKSTVNNTARDHYLRVCFPTGLQARTTEADGSFCVTQYSTTPDPNVDLDRHPAQLWYSTGDGQKGLGVLLRSTKDYEILQEDGRCTMAMSLVRGVRVRVPCDNRLWMDYPGDESGQCLGELAHDYAICPHQGDWRQGGLYRESLMFNQPMKPVQFGRQAGRLPLVKCFLSIDNPDIVPAAVKKAEDRNSVVVRVFNPTGGAIETTFVPGFEFSGARLLKLSEEVDRELEVRDGKVRVSIGKSRIETLEFVVVKT